MKKKYIIPDIKTIALCHRELMQSPSEEFSEDLYLPMSDEPQEDGIGD